MRTLNPARDLRFPRPARGYAVHLIPESYTALANASITPDERSSMLVSQGQLMWNESEEDAAWRMVLAYGPTRAFWVADINKRTARGPMRGYYWRICELIAGMQVSEPTPRKSK